MVISVDDDEDQERVGLVPDSADDAPREAAQIKSGKSALNDVVRPRGRVVGVIKRNWRP